MRDEDAQLKLELQNFGFSQKEAEVYIALLQLGKGTVSQISRDAGINRTTGYDILSSLVDKGVVIVSGKEPKQEYAAEPPMTVIAYLKRERQKIERNLEKAEKIVHDLTLLHTFENRPKIRFYEGRDGLRTVYEDTLTSSEAIRAYASVEDMHAALPGYFPEYYKRRAKKNIYIRAISPDLPEARERKKHDTEEKREIVLVPAETYSFSPEINIYDAKVMIASWREKLGVIIESKEIAEAMKKTYDLAWIGAKSLEKNEK